jgi:nucleotide-binding universal stress UspA family protein
VPDQHPAEGIIAIAEKNGCDLIVMASHGRRAIGRLLLGSQVNEVLAHSKVPTLVVR